MSPAHMFPVSPVNSGMTPSNRVLPVGSEHIWFEAREIGHIELAPDDPWLCIMFASIIKDAGITT